MSKLSDLEQEVRDEVRERASELREDPYPEDTLFELVDGSVPIYNADILAIVSEDPSLWNEEPELGPAFDGSPTPANIGASIIFDHLHAAAFAEWSEVQDEDEDEDEDEDGTA